MKNRSILRVLTGVSAFATATLAVLATPSLGDLVPDQFAYILGTATLVLLALKENAVVIGDYIDDGKRNNSFDPNHDNFKP